MTAGYSGTPLPRKLGIKDGSRVLLVRPPADLRLDPMPATATIHRRSGGRQFDVVVAFFPDTRSLQSAFTRLAGSLSVAGALWACWPKKASGVVTDLSDSAVREHGLLVGLVDVKVAAIDETWSGLKFVRRLADR